MTAFPDSHHDLLQAEVAVLATPLRQGTLRSMAWPPRGPRLLVPWRGRRDGGSAR